MDVRCKGHKHLMLLRPSQVQRCSSENCRKGENDAQFCAWTYLVEDVEKHDRHKKEEHR